VRLWLESFVILGYFHLRRLFLFADPGQIRTRGSDPGYFANWLNRVDKTQRSSLLATPLATTICVSKKSSYACSHLQAHRTENSGGKRMGVIPAERLEVILVAPPCLLVHNNPPWMGVLGDWSLPHKVPDSSSNEEHGKYIQRRLNDSPTGQYKNGATDAIITPTIRLTGKLWSF